MNSFRILAGLLIVAVLAACGGTQSSATDSAADADPTTQATEADPGTADAGSLGDFDLCDVVSSEELSEIAGSEVADTTAAVSGGVYSCNYWDAGGLPIAGSTLATPETGIDPTQMFDANVGAEGVEEVDGVGDRAVMTGDENFPVLMVLVGDNLYSLSVLAESLDGPGKREATIEMARLSADRIP